MDNYTTPLTVIIVLIAFIGESTFGFGGGLLSIPLLSIYLEPEHAIALVAIFQLLVGILVFTTYKEVEWSLVGPVVLGTLPGTILGILALGSVQDEFVRWFLAIFILAFLIKSRYFPLISFSKKSLLGGITSGLLFGFFQGSLGLGGPNLVIYFKELSRNTLSFRAHAILLLSIANLIRVLILPSTDMLDKNVLDLTIIILPFFIVGIFAGSYISKVISQRTYSILVEIMLGISFLGLVLKNLIS